MKKLVQKRGQGTLLLESPLAAIVTSAPPKSLGRQMKVKASNFSLNEFYSLVHCGNSDLLSSLPLWLDIEIFLFIPIWVMLLEVEFQSLIYIFRMSTTHLNQFLVHGRLSRSKFPPHSKSATFFTSAVILLNLSLSTAASTTPDDGSMTIFIRSKTSRVAEMISSSVTVMTSSILSNMIGHVISPTLVLRPSAIVSGGPKRRYF